MSNYHDMDMYHTAGSKKCGRFLMNSRSATGKITSFEDREIKQYAERNGTWRLAPSKI